MASTKLKLNQLQQDTATEKQVVKWNNSTSTWEPSTTSSGAGGVYSGSGQVGVTAGNNILATINLGGSLEFRYNSGSGGILISGADQTVYTTSQNGDFLSTVSNSDMTLEYVGGAGNMAFIFASSGTTFQDSRVSPRGIEYGGIYNSTFSSLSLVTKGYVDAVVLSGGADGNGIYTGDGTVPNNTDATVLGDFRFAYSGAQNALNLSNSANSVTMWSKNSSSLVSVDNIQAGMVFSANSFVIDSTGSRLNHNLTIGIAGIETSALLELDSITKALLVSRMTTAQRNAMTAVNGMVVYNSTTNSFSVRQNGVWVDISTGGADGNGIYTGSGNVPNATDSTVLGVFRFLYAGDGEALTIDAFNGFINLQDNGGVAILNLTNTDASIGYNTNSLVINTTGSLFNGTGVTIGAAGLETSAGLEIDSTIKALLISRMTTAQKNALTAVNGMLLYDATLNKFALRENGTWVGVLTGSIPPGGLGDVLQGGNSFAAPMIIGTNDSNSLTLESFNIPRLRITTDGQISLLADALSAGLISDRLVIQSNFTGSGTTGSGGRILFTGESSAAPDRTMASMAAVWADATDGSRTGDMLFQSAAAGPSVTETMKIRGGATPTVRIGGGTTDYANAGITTTVAFTIGNSLSTLNLGNSTGKVTLTSSDATNTAIVIDTTGQDSSTTFGVTTYTSGSLLKKSIRFGDTLTLSGSADYSAIAIENIINSSASAPPKGLVINPTLTVAGGYRGIDIVYSNAAAWGVYQQGVNTPNYFNGQVSIGTNTVVSGTKLNITGHAQVTGQYHSLLFTNTYSVGIAVNFNNSNTQEITLSGPTTVITFSNGRTGGRYLLKVKQDGTGSRVVSSWAGGVLWSGGTAPTLTLTSNKTDIISLFFDGTTYFATAALNF